MKFTFPRKPEGLTLLGSSIILSVVAQFLLKQGMNHVGAYDGDSGMLDFCLRMVNPWIGGGLFLYAVGTVFWILTLTVMDLGFAYPFSSLQYVLVFAGAWYFFQDQIGLLRVLALLVICLGVVVISMEPNKK